MQTDSRQESNAEEKAAKKNKKREPGSNQPLKVMYRLYRSDNLGNANEVAAAEYEELLANFPNLEAMLRNPDEIDTSNIEEIKSK